MKIVCVLALPNHSSWTPSMQIVQGYFHLVSKVPMNKQFNSIHIYRGWSISKRSAEKSNQQTMFSRLESKETKGRGEREGDNRKRSSTRRSVPRREQLQREILNFCGELIEKALLAPLALLRGTNLDIWSEWSRSRWKKAWGQCPWSTELIGLSAFLFSIKTILIPLKPQALPKGFKFYKPFVFKSQRCLPKSATGILSPRRWKQLDQRQAKCIFAPKRWQKESLIQCQQAFLKHPRASQPWLDDMSTEQTNHKLSFLPSTTDTQRSNSAL